MATCPYAIYDVFTTQRLAGNPLAVVFEADALDDGAMAMIAAEFNLSETVFVRTPSNPAHTASLRIFMPSGELPFAGHPTIGSAVALAERDDAGADRLMMLEERVGPVRVALHGGPVTYAEFDLPLLPARQTAGLDVGDVSEALGLSPTDIGFENHVISQWSAGVPFLCVPIASGGAMAEARLDADRWLSHFPGRKPRDVLSPYLYNRETIASDCAFHARMLAGHHGVVEDAATGSAVAALCGAITVFDGLDEGPNVWTIEQGIEMGRPSRIRLEVTGRNGTMAAARIGGHAVKFAEGSLSI